MNPPAKQAADRVPRSTAAPPRKGMGAWACRAALVMIATATAAPAAGPEVPGTWALAPLERPDVPPATPGGSGHPIDRFVAARLAREGLAPSPPADPRVLVRRVFFDVHGLPPSPADVAAFAGDPSPVAWERLVDRLLASPRYGERWARHWMDVARFAETHGHDEDAIRPNAWPYRDYLIRSFNADKPWDRMVREQVAGDVLFPDDPEAIVATAFLAAGPWDSSSQMGIQDGTIDKKVAQYLDRDEMLSAVMSGFLSLTVHCARCHDHKFDPVPAEDYYALQAVFAGVERIDRPYDPDPAAHRARRELSAEKRALEAGDLAGAGTTLEAVEARPDFQAWLAAATADIDAWSACRPGSATSDGESTVTPQPDGSFLFGGTRPETETATLAVELEPGSRVTAVRLEVLDDDSLPHRGPGRQDNGNLHLSEIRLALDRGGATTPRPLTIASATADFDQAGWDITRAIDGDPATAWGIYPAVGKPHAAAFVLAEPIEVPAGGARLVATLAQLHGGGHLIGRPRLSVTDSPAPGLRDALPAPLAGSLAVPAGERTPSERGTLARFFLLAENARRLAALPAPSHVFAVAREFDPKGNFRPPGATPREVLVLERGSIHAPGEPAAPGALTCLSHAPARFELEDPDDEGARRAALAEWLAHRDNPLFWRSIANRVWQHHFGAGLVATPNDFGAMGARPTHRDLLDWLAAELRDSGGSLKHLHRLILASATWRQASAHRADAARIDAGNRLLWRFTPRRLDAESLRDTMLAVSGKLDPAMFGPSARQFVEGPPVHVTPTLDYLGFDPDDPANFRRSVYRFVFRTVPDPFMQALDCPDASQAAPVRAESFTAPQALALLNSPFAVRQAGHLADRIAGESDDPCTRVARLFELLFQRDPTPGEAAAVAEYADRHGLANACRILLNGNEFVFVD